MSDKTDTSNHPTVKALEAHRLRMELNDSQFATRLRVAPASWTTMRDGTYGAENKEPMLERLASALSQLEDQAATANLRGTRSNIVQLRHIRAAVKAVKNASAEERNRLVVYLAHTGGGKSTLGRHLKTIYLDSLAVIQATETWRDSYFAALLATAKALDLTADFDSARAAETAVVEHLALAPRILVVDEAHHGGKAAMNLLKLILNVCPETRIVVLAIPQLWDRMQQANAPEAAQLRSRTCAKIVVPDVGAMDCADFLASKMAAYATLKGDTNAVVAAACDAANRFGLFDTLQRICDDAIIAKSTTLTLADITAAIKRVEALRS